MNISDRAKQGFDQFVQHCMRTTLVPSGRTEIGMVAMDSLAPPPRPSRTASGFGPAAEPRGAVVMLTVASSSFSLVLFLHHEADAASLAKRPTQHGLSPAHGDEQAAQEALADALAETGNLFCGALNRELGRVFPLVGMSTPHRLDAHCVDHLALLRYGHVRHFRMALDDGSHRLASYCVCAYGDVDFIAPPVAAGDVGVGELEMF
ncbi:hypothetical protein [Roseateles amylovorans]|uniref:Chemotaxis phosphatase CheX-like domain-containing protein n=1 Tax=Roseateles amylovorans TaxID=2978473 RepID=A0ABY6B777_9BURK|nr:hypothetical protein [Roseateles amylovorans]UXH79070.1 hypothetical protein N4261_03800 [Roseateles amylovorans]